MLNWRPVLYNVGTVVPRLQPAEHLLFQEPIAPA